MSQVAKSKMRIFKTLQFVHKWVIYCNIKYGLKIYETLKTYVFVALVAN